MHDNDVSKKRARALNIATLRAVVAAYLVYLGGSLVYDLLQGRSTLTPAAAWGLGLLFAAAGLAFGYYTWRRWKADKKAAEAQDGNEKAPADDGGR